MIRLLQFELLGRFKDPISRGWAITAIGFLGFIAWALLFELDQGVFGYGHLVANEGKVSVVSPATGLIVEIKKRPGDSVVSGEPVLIFDTQLLTSKLSGLKESINGIRSSVESLEVAFESRTNQVNELSRQVESFTKLSEIGFAAKTYVSSLTSQLSLARSELHELSSSIEQSKARLRELATDYEGVASEVSRLTVRAPIDGVVMNSAISATGVTATLGSHLLDIAPTDNSLIAKVRIPPAYATQVRVNLPVDVMFPTLPGSSTLRLTGVLFHLSGDQITDQRSSETYLEGYVRLANTSEQERLGLRAGLPTTVIVKTGRRTLMSYLTRPLMERVARGLQ